MKYLILFFLSLMGMSAHAQAGRTGTELLDKCGELVNLLDNKSYNADIQKVNWCAGYLEGIRDLINELRIALSANFKEYQSNKVVGPLNVCLPTGGNTAQEARIVVKYLRDHPEELSDSAQSCVVAALHKAFPCAQ